MAKQQATYETLMGRYNVIDGDGKQLIDKNSYVASLLDESKVTSFNTAAAFNPGMAPLQLNLHLPEKVARWINHNGIGIKRAPSAFIPEDRLHAVSIIGVAGFNFGLGVRQGGYADRMAAHLYGSSAYHEQLQPVKLLQFIDSKADGYSFNSDGNLLFGIGVGKHSLGLLGQPLAFGFKFDIQSFGSRQIEVAAPTDEAVKFGLAALGFNESMMTPGNGKGNSAEPNYSPGRTGKLILDNQPTKVA